MNHRWRLISQEDKFHHDFVPSVTKQLEIFSLLFPTGCSQESLRRCSLSGTLSMFCNFDLYRPDLLTVIELRSWWDSIDVGFYSDGVTTVATFPLLKIPEGLSALEMSGGAPSSETLEKSRPPRALLSCWSVCKQTDGATDCNGLKMLSTIFKPWKTNRQTVQRIATSCNRLKIEQPSTAADFRPLRDAQ